MERWGGGGELLLLSITLSFGPTHSRAHQKTDREREREEVGGGGGGGGEEGEALGQESKTKMFTALAGNSRCQRSGRIELKGAATHP